MKTIFIRYGLIALLAVLVHNLLTFAAIPTSIGKYPADLRTISVKVKLTTKDSLAPETPVNDLYLKNRFTSIKPPNNRKDTIRKPVEKNIDLLKKNSLSTLKSKGENNFITRNLFSLIIKENQTFKAQMGVNSSLYFIPFSGHKIRNIRIQQLDIFGPTLQDTLKEASSWLEKSGNTIHMKTTEHKLRGQLLFSPGEKVSPLLMAENEKIIRDLPYIQDVAIIITYNSADVNEVDVLVIVKERFEYGISGNFGSNSSELEIIDQNMFGIGHQLSAKMALDRSNKPYWGGKFNYEITDLGGKFIRTGLGYIDTYNKRGWNTYLEKRFIASKEDWAGGVSFERIFSDRFLTPYAYTKSDTAASYLNSDIWYGKQIKSRAGYSSAGNIMIAGRYLHQNYFNNIAGSGENSFFRNHDFIIGSIGLGKRSLFKNNQIYGYGITEDIPYGRYAEMAIGLDVEKNLTRPYFHFSYSKANILKDGAYFKWQAGIGGFLNNSQIEHGAILLRTNYFSKYVYLNHHPYRFFVNLELLSGINRYQEEYLVINRKFGLRDYFSLDTKGTNRIKLNIESVRFWGWNYSGFRIAHYFYADAAFLSNDIKKILRDDFYTGFGVGIRIHNESLVFNVLEIRLSWLPFAPKDQAFIFNAFGQPKAKFDDFLGGKPQEILYQ